MTLTTLSTLKTSDQYFGGRRLAMMDQFGSVVQNCGSQVQGYFPWGEPKGTVNPQDTWNFATYWPDSFDRAGLREQPLLLERVWTFHDPGPIHQQRA